MHYVKKVQKLVCIQRGGYNYTLKWFMVAGFRDVHCFTAGRKSGFQSYKSSENPFAPQLSCS
jgi:hypothetical protein